MLTSQKEREKTVQIQFIIITDNNEENDNIMITPMTITNSNGWCIIILMMAMIIPIILIFMIIFTIGFQLMAVTASAYLVAWGPFSVLCIWEMVVQPKVLLNYGHKGDGDD